MVTLVWDVDDVLNDLMYAWLEYQKQMCRLSVAIQYRDFIENPPHRLLGISKENYLDSLDTFRADRYRDLVPIASLVQWFEAHGAKARHIALTAVPFSAVTESANWVFTHFGRWIRTYHYVPSRRSSCQIPVYDQSKRDFLQWIQKADCLVDDNEDNVKQAQSLGIQAILFPRPWNSARDRPVESVLLDLLMLT